MSYYLHTLNNGIRLIHEQTKGETGYCGIMMNTGSRDEEPRMAGMAHLIEHLLFKGTEKRKAYHILSRMENVGGEINAFTTKEETFLYTSFLKDDFQRALELLSDMVRNSTFPDHEIEKEKEVVQDEIKAYEDNPIELIYDEFENEVYSGQSLGHFILGQPDTVNKFTRRQIMEFFRDNYFTDEMIIASIGNIDFERLVYFAEKYFGIFPLHTRRQPRNLDGAYIRQEKTFRKHTSQAHCIVGIPGFPYPHPQRPGLILLNNILGGQGLNSRLNLSLREKRGYAYTVESSYNSYTDSGILSIYFGTDSQHVNKSVDLTLKEFHKLRTKKLGPVQLDRAKKQLTGILIRQFENPENRLPGMAKSLLYFNTADTLKEKILKIEQITSEQLCEIANEVLDPENASIITYLP